MTNFDKKIMGEWGRAFLSAVIAFILLLLACVMCGCKTQYVPVETVRTEYREADTTAIYNRLLAIFESRKEKESQSDSLIDRMKETVVINEQGDTTRHDKERIVYRATAREKELEQMLEQADRLLRDMHTQLLSVKSDSIQVPYPVERELTRWEKTKMDFGGIAFGGLGASVFVIALLAWLARKRRK
ncbi:MAG: hypothetical protein K2N48_01310 [Muribaculaceae bacterium]|nr:hypothetical protein [Muribaculaceae bacterium]